MARSGACGCVRQAVERNDGGRGKPRPFSHERWGIGAGSEPPSSVSLREPPSPTGGEGRCGAAAEKRKRYNRSHPSPLVGEGPGMRGAAFATSTGDGGRRQLSAPLIRPLRSHLLPQGEKGSLC